MDPKNQLEKRTNLHMHIKEAPFETYTMAKKTDNLIYSYQNIGKPLTFKNTFVNQITGPQVTTYRTSYVRS